MSAPPAPRASGLPPATAERPLRDSRRARARLDARSESVRDALLRAGRSLFSASPADAVSIDDIVREAGVAKGSFYKHFPDKETLLAAVAGRIRDRIEGDVAAANAGICDPALRVARAMCVYFRFVALEPQQGGVLVRNDRAAEGMPSKSLNKGTVDDVAEGLRTGRFILANVDAGALYVLGVGHAGLVRFTGAGDDPSAPWLAQNLCQLVLRGLGVPFPEAELIAAQAAEAILHRPAASAPQP